MNVVCRLVLRKADELEQLRPMKRVACAAAFAALSLWPITPAQAYGLSVGGVLVDPTDTVRRDLLETALKVWAETSGARRDLLVVVDFSLPSSAPRLHVVDMASGRVTSYLTAHGKGSDPDHDGRADTFSNTPNSLASSIGAYLTGSRYQGKHGLSLRLKGLDETNSEAEARAIVLHSAAYMNADFRKRHGQPGRSFGCFVVETGLISAIVASLEGGVLIYAGA